MYLTCNPGGVGHAWVKRLFVDKQYKDGENAEDYCFIPATVEDNRVLMKNSPQYVALLDMLPEDIRAAHRYGDWNALSGAYFPELRESIHRRNAVDIRGKTLYRAIDYGLDMLACLWIAVDENGCAEVYRELKEPGLIVSAACARILESTSQSENIALTFAPPDLRSRQKDSGRSLQELFALSGVPLTFASNSRTAGWLSLRERFRQDKPTLFISRSCPKLWHDLATIQHSKTDPNDCATEPHELTHLCDALRYFAVMRPFKTPRENAISSYERFMLGAMGW